MFDWVATVATLDGSRDAWAYTHKGKTLATVEKVQAGMWRYKVIDAKIEGTETTRTMAMMTARREYERHEQS